MRTPAVEQAMERDRAYFVAHPDHRYYDRPLLPGEFGEGGGSGTVRVTQIGLGLRSRKLIAGAVGILTNEMIEPAPAPMPEWLLSEILKAELS